MKTNCTQDIVGADDELTYLHDDHTVRLVYSYIVYVMRMDACPAVRRSFEVCFNHQMNSVVSSFFYLNLSPRYTY